MKGARLIVSVKNFIHKLGCLQAFNSIQQETKNGQINCSAENNKYDQSSKLSQMGKIRNSEGLIQMLHASSLVQGLR
jgi:hypothetical protein